MMMRPAVGPLVCCLVLALCAASSLAEAAGVPVVTDGVSGQAGQAVAMIVIPVDAQPIAEYAADELARHIELATGVKLPVAIERAVPKSIPHRIYIGSTRAAAEDGIDVDTLPSEAFVLRTAGGNLFIAAKDGLGDPLAMENTFSGSLWGVYEVLGRDLGVRWLWLGDLGTCVPKAETLTLGPYDETVTPRLVHRMLRPSISSGNPPNGDLRLAFTEAEREQYAQEQTVFLRRHRMGSSAKTYFTQRTSGSGHSFEGWWERYGQEHPEWFQLCPDGRRGPADPNKPAK